LFASTVDEPVPDYLIAILLEIEEGDQRATAYQR
jgi:hypothetical protein